MLDRRGIPTEFVVYPRTPHGSREPKFLMDVTDRNLKWGRAKSGEVEGEPLTRATQSVTRPG